MKKILTVLCLTCIPVFVSAEQIYEYKNTQPINDINSIRTRGCNEYVEIEPTVPFVARNIIASMARDPYIIEINGIKYVLVKDRKDKNWSEQDLLGINDPKNNRFQSLINLNSDRDHSKITANELKKAGIRFVRMDDKGALLVNDRSKDFDLNKVDYIDIINLKRTANAEVTGIFGHFTLYLKTTNPKKRTAVGFVTYETDEKIQYLFK